MRMSLMRGNDAVVAGALLAHCEAFFGYPITPANEICEGAARLFPLAGRTFVQAESELAAINMVFGASSAGARCLTASSGPGISLKMEGISYLACAELPAVIADICRVGPGLGNIYPSQGDYNQLVKGGGHGEYRAIVLAPNSAQEMCDFTVRAFDLADRYRTPVFVFADGCVGQMMESVSLPDLPPEPPAKPWALTPEASANSNLITSIFLEASEMEAILLKLQAKYAEIARTEVLCETFRTDDADIVLVGFGIVSRVLRSVVEEARAEGMRVGLMRPQTLFPFPIDQIRGLSQRAKSILVVEMNNGQMVDDVRLAVGERCPVEFHGKMGGELPTIADIMARLRALMVEA
jgi:2-oxoisovalerate ferredoxin oxidoreductase alpha subunit